MSAQHASEQSTPPALESKHPVMMQRLATLVTHWPIALIVLGLLLTATWVGILAWFAVRVVARVFI